MNAILQPHQHFNKVDFKPKDYKDEKTPSFWCAGCGHYGVLTGLLRALAELGVDPNHLVSVSGIGCSSRLPYFVTSYNMHTLHGRAGPVATGVHLARPDLAVVVTGGEPLLQERLNDFLKKLKGLGYFIKLDPNGSFPERLKDIIEKKLVDYLAMDIKASLEKYASVVESAVEIKKIKESINLIMNSGLNYEFRTTIVKSQLKKEDILKIGELLKPGSLYILQKFVPSKTLNPRFLKKSSYSNEELEEIKRKLKELYNLNCIIR